MGQKYNQLTKEDRHTVAVLKRRKFTQKEIAAEIGHSERTVRRELKRGTANGREYNAADAHQKKLARKRRARYLGMKIDARSELEAFVVTALRGNQRPEAIAGRLKTCHGSGSTRPLPPVSSKTIYSWLYSPQGQRYAHLLPSQRYKPKKQRQPKTKRMLIPARTPLSERPNGANNRSRYGHTASDTMVSGKKTGSKAAIVGTVERKLRFVTLAKLSDLHPDTMNAGLTRNFAAMGIAIHTDTKDNGIENTAHLAIEQTLGIKSYFCEPYSSWQKGEIEHIFKLVRAEGIPKGMDLGLVSYERLQAIQDTLNNRWRKSLGYYSPAELMVKRRLHEQKIAQKQRTAHAVRYTTNESVTTTLEKADT